MYNPKSAIATEFICDAEILDSMKFARENCRNKELIMATIAKAGESGFCRGR